MGFFGALGLLFIGLKLADVIDWSWWLVTLPLYGGFVFIFVLYVIAVTIKAWRRTA